MFSSFRNTPNKALENAAAKNKTPLVQKLLKKNTNFKDTSLNLSLYYAIQYDNSQMLTLLFESKANINYQYQNHNQKTPLHLAVTCDNEHIVTQLIEYKADINIEDAKNLTPLMACTEDPSKVISQRILKTLLDHKADINQIRRDGNTMLGYTLKQGEKMGSNNLFNNVKMLLENNADINYTNREGHSILGLCVKDYYFPINRYTVMEYIINHNKLYINPDELKKLIFYANESDPASIDILTTTGKRKVSNQENAVMHSFFGGLFHKTANNSVLSQSFSKEPIFDKNVVKIISSFYRSRL